jgi:hypothetical protein
MTRNNMQAADRNQDDAGIAQRYLAGQLSPAEQEAYEQYFIHNPDAVRELEATARMKVGLASLRDSNQLDSLLQAAPTTSRRAALMAIAASVAVIAIAVGLWREVRVPDGAALVASATRLVDASGKPLAVGAIYAVMRTRATGYDAVVTLPPQPQALELRVLPESFAPGYSATLSRTLPGGAVAQPATVGKLQAGDDGLVRLFVDSSKLKPGLYVLVLSASGDQSEEVPTSSFRLKVNDSDVNLNPARQ